MNDTYQGKIGTISPAFGAYDINISINYDRDMGVTGTDGYTGPGAAGVTGSGTLEAWRYDMGVTGNFTNNRADEQRYF